MKTLLVTIFLFFSIPLSYAQYKTTLSQYSVISVDAVTTSVCECTSRSFAHTISGVERLLIVGISLEKGDPSKRISNVSYDGQDLTRLAEIRGPSNDPRVDVWYIINPPTGTANVNVTLQEDNKIVIGAVSITGVHQSTPFGEVVTAGGSEGHPTILVNSQIGNFVMDVVASLQDNLLVGPLQTELYNLEIHDSGKRAAASYEAGSPLVTMSWIGDEKWAGAAFNINASGTTSVPGNGQLPEKFNLMQNYPNPFNPSTIIQFALPENSFVQLEVFNLIGEQISTLISGEMSAGYHSIEWNPVDLSSGMYLYRLKANGNTFMKKMVLLR